MRRMISLLALLALSSCGTDTTTISGPDPSPSPQSIVSTHGSSDPGTNPGSCVVASSTLVTKVNGKDTDGFWSAADDVNLFALYLFSPGTDPHGDCPGPSFVVQWAFGNDNSAACIFTSETSNPTHLQCQRSGFVDVVGTVPYPDGTTQIVKLHGIVG